MCFVKYCWGLLDNLSHFPAAREWQPLVPQDIGCLTSAWTKLAVDVGDTNATLILQRECGHEIPQHIIEAGSQRKARFAHMS